MKEIFVKIFDSLEDDYKLSLRSEEEPFKIIGFSIQLSPVLDDFYRDKLYSNSWSEHSTLIEETVKEYENKFREIIDKLIEQGKIHKIFHIYMVKLAIISPCFRFCFVCQCNDYNSNSKFEGLVEGATPPFTQMKEISEFIESY